MSANAIVFFTPDRPPGEDFWNTLRGGGFSPQSADNPASALDLIDSLKPDICVCVADAVSDALLDFFRAIAEKEHHTKLIVSIRDGSVDNAVQYMKAGAHDFLISQEGGDARLVESILRAATNYRQPARPRTGAPVAAAEGHDAVLVGRSPAMCEIRSAVNLIARSQTTVLITGESGTGKEVVAGLIHSQSPRNGMPFVTINCAAIPRDVIENELFGHEKGAFTGALLRKDGCFELANRGTILLDEIAEMTLDTQAKLLRVIETQKFRRLGGKSEVSVDVRIVAATNKTVAEALKAGELREDLYYRLSVIELHLPPVRDRREDIPVLIEHFFTVFAERYGKAPQRFSDEAMDILNAHAWPGNVREIRNVVERAIVTCPHDVITSACLPDRIRSRNSVRAPIQIPVGSSTQEAEKILILETLALAGYNKTKAARILGVSRKTLHNKLSAFQKST